MRRSPAVSATPRIVAVPRESAGERLDRFLARALALSPGRARNLAAAGRARIRGRVCSPLRRLSGGEEIEVRLPPPRSAPRAAGEPTLSVLYDDRDVLVVDKPAGLAVEPGAAGAPSAVGAASHLGRFDVEGRTLPGLPHRLDRDTTGCLLLARTDEALRAVKRAFEEGRVEKEYLAVVAGAPPATGALDTPYGRAPWDARRYSSRVESPRRARLSFRLERLLAGAALLRVRLETGRTHQIRVQLADAGFPVLGDRVYGVPSPLVSRQALHASRLSFPRPADGALVSVEAPLPPDLEGLLRALARG
ncbi:MAG TPA: RluA family pseudouridine synthase [Anaeromyxobacteraceae bacterium]|nr:RluA family pseudouridine synthase [Anaeromyxobacteraceae bacterium]